MSSSLSTIFALAAALTSAAVAQDVTAPGADMPSDSPPAIEGKNRLGNETSPYLLQHRTNPVHWYPWGEEAFAAARALDRPIFLSVGYSTCYWCHVMERESFEDEATAAILNEHYIAIKVDREERPDVDDIYMMAVNILNRGQGGWPMSVFIEPETLEPFTAGTYFPPEDRAGQPGFKSVLTQIADAWRTQREAVMQHADRVARLVESELSELPEGPALGATEVQGGLQALLGSYDGQHGGWGQRNKFPMPVNLEFLMLAGGDDEATRTAVNYTLDRMATGGIYDHIGGGFHRYSVDLEWQVPHFEKMLYDNAQLASLYAAAFERTGDAYYGRIVREVLDYVLREMTSPTGAFYSAQDAEVNHREGGNYIWVAEEIRAALTEAGLADDVDFALEVYGFNAGTNFQDPHHPEDGRKNVVFLVAKPGEQAKAMGMTLAAFEARERRVDEALLAARMKRDQPITDDKVLTGWNGLMIGGMADGGRALGEPRYLDAAQRAARFVLETMRDPATGELLRTYRDGTAKIPAFAEDYAFLIAGLLSLHRATGDDATLAEARGLAADARARFWDDAKGGYFDTQIGQADLFVRARSTYDGAVPSANGVMVNNLFDLHALTGEDAYLDDAVATLRSLAGVLAARPTGAVMSLIGLKRLVDDHPDRLGDTGTAVGPAASAAAEGPVTIAASTDVLEIADGGEASFEITVDVADGYHVNSHEPGIDYLIPLEVKLVVGGGLALSVEYPAGERFDGPEGAMNVHHGRVTLPVRVKRQGDVPAGARIAVSYQVCTDRVCLAPATVTLPIRIR